MSDDQVTLETAEGTATDGIRQIPAQTPTHAQESPTVAVARERLVEAIGREAVFLADQRAGRAFEGLEALSRAFALLTSAQSLTTNQSGATVAGRRQVAFDTLQAVEDLETAGLPKEQARGLSIQSANGTYSEEDRAAAQIEVEQLTDGDHTGR
ncbi:hypothetical protein [Streptomyces sp. NPDC093093]|uniref:hypothetical protein n=1 Tax=Streptomyces sp. NPDC093093 TaxID=3366025 RepID=UPI003810C2DD